MRKLNLEIMLNGLELMSLVDTCTKKCQNVTISQSWPIVGKK